MKQACSSAFQAFAHDDAKFLASRKHTEVQHILKHGMREFMVHNSMTLAIKIRLYTLIMMILISPTSLVMDIEIYNSLLWQFTSKHGREPMPAYNL